MTSNERHERFDVSIVGELNPDLILYGLPRDLPEERETLASGFTMTLGSSSAILAHNLASLGTRVSFTSRIGPDALGEMCCQRLRDAGVDLSGVVRSATGSSTGVTLILPLTDTRRILTYPGAMFEMGIDDIDIGWLASAGHFHMSSLFLHRRLSPDIPDLFREMKRRGLSTSLDTNDDPDDRWEGGLNEVLKYVDVLLPNEREACKMAAVEDFESAIRKLSERVPLVAVKLGPKGALAQRGSERFVSPPVKVVPVDTVGAGDSFDAGFLHEYVQGADLWNCLEFGNLVGALSTTRTGGTEAFRDADYRKNFFREHTRDSSSANKNAVSCAGLSAVSDAVTSWMMLFSVPAASSARR